MNNNFSKATISGMLFGSLFLGCTCKLFAQDTMDTKYPEKDFSFTAENGTTVTATPASEKDITARRNELQIFDKARESLYSDGSTRSKILRALEYSANSDGPHQSGERTTMRQSLVNDLGVNVNDAELNREILDILLKDNTLRKRQVLNAIQILSEANDDGWIAINQVLQQLDRLSEVMVNNEGVADVKDKKHADKFYRKICAHIVAQGRNRVFVLEQRKVSSSSAIAKSVVTVLGTVAKDKKCDPVTVDEAKSLMRRPILAS